SAGHPDGRTLLASAGVDATVRVWDPVTGQPVGAALTGHTGAVWGVCALAGWDSAGHPDGRTLLASAGQDATVRVWDPVTGQPVGATLTGHTSAVLGVCALAGWDSAGHPDGRTLLAPAWVDATVRVWDPVTGQPVGAALTGHTSGVLGVCALAGWDSAGHPDGRTLLASAGQDGTVRVWDPVTGQPVGAALTGHTGAVWGVCALAGWDSAGHPDGRTLLASAGVDATVRVWDPVTGQPVGAALTGHTGGVYGVCALVGWDSAGHPDGRTLLASAGVDATVRVWDPVTGQPIGDPLAESPTCINAITTRGATGTDCLALAGDGTLHRWSASTASLTTIPSTGHPCALTLHTSTDREVLLTGDTAGQLHTTDPATQLPLHPPIRIDDGAVLALCTLPNQPASLAAAGRNATITLHPLNNPTTEPTHTAPQLHGHTGPVRALCLINHPDHPPLLASAGNDATIRLWDLHSAAPHGTPLTGHDGWIWAITPVPSPPGQGPRLASAGADATIRFWDLLTGHPIGRPLTGHTDQVRALTSVTTADGNSTLLVSGSHDGTVRLWDPTTGTPPHTIPPPPPPPP